MKRHRLPFLATDRSVLNLPAIGKSMSFRLVGITPEGRRILRFDHDRTRRHSPIIDRMGEIYIVENKSVAAYLRQLEKMGEDAEDYASIWDYTHGRDRTPVRALRIPRLPVRGDRPGEQSGTGVSCRCETAMRRPGRMRFRPGPDILLDISGISYYLCVKYNRAGRRRITDKDRAGRTAAEL